MHPFIRAHYQAALIPAGFIIIIFFESLISRAAHLDFGADFLRDPLPIVGPPGMSLLSLKSGRQTPRPPSTHLNPRLFRYFRRFPIYAAPPPRFHPSPIFFFFHALFL